MKNKINRWSKLEAKQQTQRYDLGGTMQVAGGIAGMLPIPGAKLIGGALNLIGGIANNAKQKKEEEATMRLQKMQETQATMLAAPKSGQGLAQGQLAYGGYLTPSLLAKRGLVIPPDGKPTKTVQKESSDDQKFMDFAAKSMTKEDFAKFGNSPEIQKQLRLDYEAQKPKGKVGNPNAKGTTLGIDNKDKPAMSWYPSSAALSQYKMGNKDVIFGHYSSDKYGSASQGTPIRYNDLINLDKNPKYKDILPKDFDALREGVGYKPDAVVKMAKGGYANPLSMPNNGLFSFQGGGTHNQNPLGGIPIGKSLQGEQRTVEDKEAAFTFTGEKKGTNGKYIFSHRLILKK